MLFAAIVAASGALLVASFTLFVTAPWLRFEVVALRRESNRCERRVNELRLQLEIVQAAVLRTLPREDRLELLATLAEKVASE
jgi:hypothetical protein